MSISSRIWLVVVLSLLIIGSTASAKEKVNANEGGKAAADANPDIAYLTVSGELARIASENKDAILMLAAARLEAMVVTEKLDTEKASEGDDTAETDVESKPEKESLYAMAEQYAGTNEALHTVINNSKSFSTTRSAVGGVKLKYDSVLAGTKDIYDIDFYGGEPAVVTVEGDGDTDLDLYVYDEYGNRICSDTDYSDLTYCSWVPSWTGTFRIEIENLGNVYNNYRLATN